MSNNVVPGIYEATAPWQDEQALATLLAPLPNDIAKDIREAHVQRPDGSSGMHYDDERSRRAYYVVADATFVRVWTFPPCSFEQAAEMWVLIDHYRTDAEECMEPATLDIVKRAFSEIHRAAP